MGRGEPWHFFEAFVPPKATKQMHEVAVVRDKLTGEYVPRFHKSRAWDEAEATLRAYLERHRPDEPLSCGVVLDVTWCFPADGHADGEPYLAVPDTDNLEKGLKDVMTDLGWWEDDRLVFSEHATKIHSSVPGLRIDVEAVGER